MYINPKPYATPKSGAPSRKPLPPTVPPAPRATKGRKLTTRLLMLTVGLCLFGAGIGLMARADLGLGPWSVLHDGIAVRTGLQLGTVEILLSLPILLAWLPLGERPGLGTLLSPFLIGFSINGVLASLAPMDGLPSQLALLVSAVGVIAVGSALYLSAQLGPGPRDGLMTGMQRRFGWPIGPVRTGLEVAVLALGIGLGGTIGLGTIAYALLIGPAVASILKLLGSHAVLHPQPHRPAQSATSNIRTYDSPDVRR